MKKCPAEEGTVKQSTFVVSLASVILIFSAVGAGCYVRQQRIMKEQVRGMIKEYMPLDMTHSNMDTALEQDDIDTPTTTTMQGKFT
jgi:hypothetical protein